MLRKLWAAAAVVGALAVPAVAGDDAVKLGRFQPGSDAGFTGSPEGAAANDTELTHYHGGWGGYRGYGWGGYYGGFYGGYRSFYYGGYPYWGGYNYYRPAFAYSYYPSYYYPSFGYGYYSSGFFPIKGGTSASASARTVTLGMSLVPKSEYASTPTPATPAALPQPAQPALGTFQYDGDPTPSPAATVPVKGKYQFTAYGEKR